MKIEQDIKLDFDDVLLRPQHSKIRSRKDVEVERSFQFYHSHKTWTGVPIMCANMSFASFNLAKALAKHKMITCLHKFHSKDQILDFFVENPGLEPYVWVTIGWDDKYLELVNNLLNENQYINFCIDVANGHIQPFIDYCKQVRVLAGFNPIIMAGNVANPTTCERLIDEGGVDIVKIGIGPGSACSTRSTTGVGLPQLSNVIECSSVHGLEREPKRLGLICADGGMKTPGDVAKAFCGGADFCMLGGFWAGCDECDGDWNYHHKTEYHYGHPMGDTSQRPTNRKMAFTYYGMSSFKAQQTHYGEIKDYRTSEGEVIMVEYKGLAETLVNQMLGGIRSTGTYIGAKRLKDFNKCANFIRVNRIK